MWNGGEEGPAWLHRGKNDLHGRTGEACMATHGQEWPAWPQAWPVQAMPVEARAQYQCALCLRYWHTLCAPIASLLGESPMGHAGAWSCPVCAGGSAAPARYCFADGSSCGATPVRSRGWLDDEGECSPCVPPSATAAEAVAAARATARLLAARAEGESSVGGGTVRGGTVEGGVSRGPGANLASRDIRWNLARLEASPEAERREQMQQQAADESEEVS